MSARESKTVVVGNQTITFLRSGPCVAEVRNTDGSCLVRGCNHYADTTRVTEQAMFALDYCGAHSDAADALFYRAAA